MSDNETSTEKCDDINVYKCSDEGLVMPFVNEYTWSVEARIVLYLVGLLWCFLGVAIIADVFMCSIEKITSKTRRIRIADPEKEEGYSVIEVKVWNNTVANLTLMALGSSAPEILLACIEIVGNKFEAGPLGPSTIVGSAAFNLFCITAVCVLAIPSPDTRRINAIKVFGITAFFSVFAYVWLLIVLVAITPNYVDIWEAVVTLVFFPILVIIAYLADKDFCQKQKVESDQQVALGFEGGAADGQIDNFKMRKIVKELRAIHPHLTDEDIAKLATLKMQEEQSHNHLWYRINASRRLGGGPKLTPSFDEALEEIYEHLKEQHGDKEEAAVEPHFSDDLSENSTKAVVEFTAAQVSVMEADKRVRLNVVRYGKMNQRVLFRVETIDGTAEAEKDYKPIKTTLVFEKDEAHKSLDIEIIDDNEWEPDEVFFVKMSLDTSEPSSKTALLGNTSICEVTIINDDDPGVFEFAKPSLIVKESAGKALIPIERSNGCDGTVKLKWKTEDMTATNGQDFEGGEGEIVFEHGETTKTLEIAIYDDQEFEKDETFKVDLVECDVQGAKLGRIKKTIVTIVNDDEFNGMVDRLVNMTNMNLDALRVDSTTYAQQFRNAMNVNGGDLEGATHMDYLMHFLTFGWKIVFAIVPPPSYLGGWLSFFTALVMIGALTTVVGDLATIFGCLTGLRAPVTAITFVALGTSLPDLFASKQAALMEKTADNSIGNVTGSNSVNVFLGLGVPWTIASIYWSARGKSFEVPAKTLGFSVMLYSICACLCIALLLLRRFLGFFGKAELGGRRGPQIASAVFLVSLWIIYVLLSSLVEYGHIPAF